MFSGAQYKAMYRRFMGPLAQPVTLMKNNGTNFNYYEPITAYVTNYQERDLVAGSSVDVGDLKVIILSENLPDDLEPLDQKDRIEIDGRAYGVMNWDDYSRKVGETPVAVEVRVRG